MTSKSKHRALLVILLISISAAGFLWMRSYVFSRIGLAINEKVQSLKLSGFNVRYDSLAVDWRNNVVEIHGLLLDKNPYDTTCLYPEFISAEKLRVEGIRLFPLIFRRILDFENLYLYAPRMMMRRNSLLTLDSAAKRDNEFTLKSDFVSIQGANFEYTDSLDCGLITSVRSNLQLVGLEMEFRIDRPFAYAAESLSMDSARIRLPRAFYTFEIQHVSMDFGKDQLAMDSISVIPDFGKVEFGRQRGYETDRFDGVIPFIRLSDFTFSFADTTRVAAAMAEVQFYVKIFRDKRLPFKKVFKPLPIDALQDLPFGLAIDSLKITKSYVQYEEFPEESADPGGIFFDDIYALITNVNNGDTSGEVQLSAQASLMGQGNIALAVTFPLSRNKRSFLKGSLKDFPMEKINAMLTPSTNIKVESGQMKELSFSFRFNATRSDGEIELNYKDLKLISYKEEDKEAKDEGLQKDNLKTFIMNTFVFRKNMGEDVPEEKRTGTVMYARDENRSIFNFWVKSLLSGLKSAYNLDKTAEKKSEREAKKEERLARKLERKQKKAEKKKERG